MKPEVTINSLEGITITVNVSRQFHIRMAIGTWLIRLAAWVMGAKSECHKGNSSQ